MENIEKPKQDISETNSENGKNNNLALVIILIVSGIVLSTSSFYLPKLLCQTMGSTGDVGWDCSFWIHFLFSFPLTIFGFIALIWGLVKLNRYMKNRKNK